VHRVVDRDRARREAIQTDPSVAPGLMTSPSHELRQVLLIPRAGRAPSPAAEPGTAPLQLDVVVGRARKLATTTGRIGAVLDDQRAALNGSLAPKSRMKNHAVGSRERDVPGAWSTSTATGDDRPHARNVRDAFSAHAGYEIGPARIGGAHRPHGRNVRDAFSAHAGYEIGPARIGGAHRPHARSIREALDAHARGSPRCARIRRLGARGKRIEPRSHGEGNDSCDERERPKRRYLQPQQLAAHPILLLADPNPTGRLSYEKALRFQSAWFGLCPTAARRTRCPTESR